MPKNISSLQSLMRGLHALADSANESGLEFVRAFIMDKQKKLLQGLLPRLAESFRSHPAALERKICVTAFFPTTEELQKTAVLLAKSVLGGQAHLLALVNESDGSGRRFLSTGGGRPISTVINCDRLPLDRRVCKKIEQPLQADVRQYSTDVCWISNSLPRHDTASSDLRVFELMKLIGSLDRKQTFLYFSQSPEDQRYKKDVWHMARCRFVPFQPEKYITLLAEKRPRQLWITNIWTPGRAEFALAVVQAVRRAMPDVRIVIDTMDFHAKKYFRAYMVTRTPLELGKAEQFLQLEKKLYPLVDAVVVVSQKEADDLRENISGLPLVAIIPNIVHPHPRIAGPEGRNDLVFLGNFDVMHNRDAVDWFVNRVLPLVRADDPGIRLHLVGTNAEKYYRDIPDAGLVVEGFVENLEESLARYRVFVCPLTYGAGMKGKIGSAFACGLPVVTTDVGAEGFGIKSGENALVENDPQAFALGCLRLLHDDELWQSLSRGGWNLLQQINEQSGARETVISLLQLSSSGMS